MKNKFIVADIVLVLDIDNWDTKFPDLESKQKTSYQILQRKIKVFEDQLNKYAVAVCLKNDDVFRFITPTEYLWRNGIDNQNHLGQAFALYDSPQAAFDYAKQFGYPLINIYQTRQENEKVWLDLIDEFIGVPMD